MLAPHMTYANRNTLTSRPSHVKSDVCANYYKNLYKIVRLRGTSAPVVSARHVLMCISEYLYVYLPSWACSSTFPARPVRLPSQRGLFVYLPSEVCRSTFPARPVRPVNATRLLVARCLASFSFVVTAGWWRRREAINAVAGRTHRPRCRIAKVCVVDIIFHHCLTESS